MLQNSQHIHNIRVKHYARSRKVVSIFKQAFDESNNWLISLNNILLKYIALFLLVLEVGIWQVVYKSEQRRV